MCHGCSYCGQSGHSIGHHGEEPWKDEEVVNSLYNQSDLSSREIAEKLGCSKTTVLRWAERFGIDRGGEGRGNPDDPWKDRDRLARLYHEEEMTTHEIAERLDCSQKTVSDWLGRHGIQTRSAGVYGADAACRDRDLLRRLYHDEKLSTREIADRLDVGHGVVYYWMGEFGIERRDLLDTITKDRAHYRTGTDGYPRWRAYHPDGEKLVRVHQLLTIAYGADPYDVFGGGYEVHHGNGVKWDNRPQNVELLRAEEHAREHHRRGDYLHSAGGSA